MDKSRFTLLLNAWKSVEHIMQFSGNRSLTQLTSQSDSNQYLAMCVGGEEGAGAGRRGDWKVFNCFFVLAFGGVVLKRFPTS